jgi:hypothetical protein
LIGAALAALFSLLPFYGSADKPASVNSTCAPFAGTARYGLCVRKHRGVALRSLDLHWNAWGSFFSWIPVLLLVAAGVAIGFKAIFFKSDKVVLNKSIRLALIFGDVLFLVAIVHIPHDNAGRSWGLWLSLLCVIALNLGALLATTTAGEWVAERWSRRQSPAAAGGPSQPAPPPTGPPVAMPAQALRQTNPYPANQGFQVDYRPGPQQVPQQREPEQTGWPQQPPPRSQAGPQQTGPQQSGQQQAGWPQSGGFPTQGEQR